MAAFDNVSKHLVQTYPADIARFGLGREDVEVLDVLDVEQPTVEARAADSLIRARVGGVAALVHTEFQTGDSTDVPMPRRMAGYVGRAVERHGLPVFSSVIYLRPEAGHNDPGRWEQHHAGHRVLVEYRVIRLIEMDGPGVLNAGRAGLLPFAALMGREPGVAPAAWVQHCADAVEALPSPRRAKVELLAGMAVLGGLVLGSAVVTEIIGEEIMQESSVVQYFTEKAMEKGLERGLIRGLERGREQGIEQGREQGIEQGREQALEDALLEVLQVRFDAGESLRQRITAIGDERTLKRLFHAGLTAASLADFNAAMEAIEAGDATPAK